MKLRHYPIIAAFALLAASCSHEESADAQRADLQLTISASFADSSALFEVDSPDSNTDHAADSAALTAPLSAPNSQSATRTNAQSAPNATRASASRATATAFESGDSLGLYAVRSGGELNAASNLINNHKFKVSSTGTIIGDMLPAFYPDQTSSLDLFSYYPYQSGNATADALGVLVGIRTHQTDFSSLMASDCCYGSKLSAAPSTAAHSLRFKHIFAQLRLNFSLYEGCPAIASVKILKVKDQAKLNLQTGVVTLLPSSTVVDIEPFVSSADAANPLQFTAILPAQPLSAACLEITLADGTIYYYHATAPIALTPSATNTLNLRIADRKLVTLDGAPVITAWGAIAASGSLGESVNNLISLYWLAPHASFAAVDKITVSIVDILNRHREVEVTPTLDPLSTAEYATYTFPLILGADAGYPQIIEKVKLYAGATLLRDAPTDGIVGRTLTKAGAHTLGLSVWIKISETAWNNVSGYGDSKTITVTPTGTTEWTATSTNPALTITKSGNTATLTWEAQTVGALARNGGVGFKTNPLGASADFTTNQLAGPAPTLTLTLTDAIGNPIPAGRKAYRASITSNTAWTASALTNLTLDKSKGAAGTTAVVVTVGATTSATTRTASVVFTTDAVPSGAKATQTWSGTQAAVPANAVLINDIWWRTMNVGSTTPQGYGTYHSFAAAPTACASLGAGWRLPTKDEFGTLLSNVANGAVWANCATGNYTTLSSVNGAWAGPGAKSANAATAIFFPAAGYGENGSMVGVGGVGNYWASTEINSPIAYNLYFGSFNVSPQSTSYKTIMLTARCVQ